MADSDYMDKVEELRQVYLEELAAIISVEKLTPEEATQLMYGEIASWLMVLSSLLMTKMENR